MPNYAPNLPRDKGGQVIEDANFQASVLATYGSENGVASSVISVSHNTTALEIAALGGAAVMRWVRTTETQASIISIAGATGNFAHVIPADTVRRFVIPIEAMATQGASMVGVNRANGLYQRVAIKTAGIASVLVTEYGF